MGGKLSARAGPFAGIRVVEFTHILAGPYCTQCLADAGADVIKIEPPTGEYGRSRGPRRVDSAGNSVTSFAAAMLRGKRSIALDLKDPAGVAVARRLIDSADVVVENYAPGALARLSLDLQQIQAERPSLITVSISLFGRGAETHARRAGLAIIAESESSIASMTTDDKGKPVVLGFPLGDMATALVAYAAVATSLYARRDTGRGRHHDISMVGSLLAMNSGGIAGIQIDPTGVGSAYPAGYGMFPASDGFVTLGVNSDSLFERLVSAMDMPELARDPRFANYVQRDAARDEVNEIISAWTAPRTAAEIVERISPTGVPCGRVATTADVAADAALHGAGFFESVEDGLGGTVAVPTNPMGFRPETQGTCKIPKIAEHTAGILAEIGIDAAEVERLCAAGAFGRSGIAR